MLATKLAVVELVGSCENGLHFLVRSQVFDFAGGVTSFHSLVRRQNEAVVINLCENAERGDETDVRAFWRFDRADSAVVRDVDVTNFKAGSLAVEAAWPEGRESTFMHQHREGVRLVDDL